MEGRTALVALVAALCYWWAMMRPGFTFLHIWKQPLWVALPIGLAFGDLPQAMIIGAAVEMVYVGLIAPGANLPSDECLAGCIAIPIALQIGADGATAILIAAPFGVLGVFLDQLRRIIHAKLAHMADAYADDCNDKAICRLVFIMPAIVNAVLRIPPVFCAVYFGADVVEGFINMLPQWILNGISAAGSCLPALGFALIIVMIGSKSYYGFWFLGFFAVKYLGLSTLAAATFAIPLAIIIVLMGMDTENSVVNKAKLLLPKPGGNDDDEDDE